MAEDLDSLILEFREISGRRDLSDVQVTRYLNRGQLYLDRISNVRDVEARQLVGVSIGNFAHLFSSLCRFVKEVWLLNGEDRKRLTKMISSEMYDNYPSVIADITRDEPSYYAPIQIRTAPYTLNIAQTTIMSAHFGWLVGQGEAYNGIITMPPADNTYVLEVVGKFYSTKLSATNLTSWWLENHFDLLLKASMRELEVDYRNTEGRKDWEGAIVDGLVSLDMDAAEGDAEDVRRMEG